MPPAIPRSRHSTCSLAVVIVASLLCGVLGVAVLAPGASAAPPSYVVAGDDPNVTGAGWGLHEEYFSELRAIITNPANFGAGGTVDATFSIATPRSIPLTAGSLDGIDVYFLSGRDVSSAEQPVLDAFVAQGGAIVASSNAPSFYDTTARLGFTLSPRVVFGDGPAGYDTTHKANAPSSVVAGQTNHPLANGPFGPVSTFENWHSVAGFTAVPAGATVIARTTITGPSSNGSPVNATLTNVATVAVVPAGARSAGSGPIVATSDVDTFSNAYTTSLGAGYADELCTLHGTGNGTLARNTFAWIAAQLGSIGTPTTTTTTTAAPTTTSTTTTTVAPTTTSTTTTTAAPTTTTTAAPTTTTSTTTTAAPTTTTTAAPTTTTSTTIPPATTTPPPAPTHGYVGLATPTRILDTRSGIGGRAVAFGAGERRSLTVTTAGVPADAEMVSLNITAVDPTEVGFLTIAPQSGSLPNVSNVNFTAGRTVANAALVAVGTDGQITIFNSAGSTHVLIDIVGYTAEGGSRLVTKAPVRIKDTRVGLGGTAIARNGETQRLAVGGVASVPTDATSVVLNVTAVDPTATAYVTVWPADQSRPTVSNLNTRAGSTVANLVIVRLPADGRIDLFNAAGDTHLIVDVLGWFTTGAGADITAVQPLRVTDTRPAHLALGAGEVRTVKVDASGATAVAVNVTAVDPTAVGFLTVYPSSTARPDTSTLNFALGRNTPNLVIVPLGPDGTIRVFNSAGSTHLLVDVVARFA